MSKKITVEQIRYKKFIKRRNLIAQIIINISVILIVLLLLGFKFEDEMPLLLLIAISLLVLHTIACILICKKLSSLHTTLYFNAYGNSTDILRSGIFKDILDEYEDNAFEGLFDSKTKVEFMEYHNNSIDIQLKRNGHEFLILIDSNEISFTVDEESDKPIIDAIPLKSIDTLEDFYNTIRKYVVLNS